MDCTDRLFAGVVFLLWLTVFVRSIPSFIDGSMFKAPYVPDEGAVPVAVNKLPFDQEKALGSNPASSSTVAL